MSLFQVVSIAFAFAFAIGCQVERPSTADIARDAILIEPSAMPEICPLAWTTRPNSMRFDDDSAGLLRMISGFWFGDSPPLADGSPDAALSNIYSYVGGSPDDSALVVLAFHFPSKESLIDGESRLASRFSSSASHHFRRYDDVLVVLGVMDEGLSECGNWFWSEVDSKLRVAV